MKTLLILLIVVVAAIYAAPAGSSAQPLAVPPFLKGAPEAKVKEFHDLLRTAHHKKDKDIDADVDAWVKKQTPEIQQHYATFKEKLIKVQKASKLAHKNAVAKLSPEAQKADEELTKIAEHEHLVGKEKKEKIDAFLKQLDPKVREELKGAIKSAFQTPKTLPKN
ncbi:hypothetical protein AB6A40_004395 [Gnathostoma spinigerum]|uniref:SXP/RAL-2 family protein Ani s 5-like cation-binding domain-containing protein n=1 Tax=Gnathostoma spinigerum TaxID=75299 RepID=A0ABD6EEP4_9BILA